MTLIYCTLLLLIGTVCIGFALLRGCDNVGRDRPAIYLLFLGSFIITYAIASSSHVEGARVLSYLVAVALAIIGARAARRGLAAARDPEGRGGRYVLQGAVGAIWALVAGIWLLWMGVDDAIYLVQMASP